MKNALVILLLNFVVLSSTAQNHFGINLDLGISGVTGSLSNYSGGYGSRKISPSGSVGFFYSKSIGNVSALNIGLQFSQYTGREKASNHNTYPDTKIKNLVWKNVSCVELPINYVYKLKKVDFGFGLRAALILRSTAKETGYSTFAGSVLVWEDQLEVNTRQFNIGPSFSLGYSINGKVNLRANYYLGLLDIYPDEPHGPALVQQLSFGVAYNFSGKE